MKITFNQGLNNTGETESNVAVAWCEFFLKTIVEENTPCGHSIWVEE